MAQVFHTSQAELDLYEIWNYIAEDSYEAANRLLDEIDDKFRLLAEYPEIGRSRDEVTPSLRSFPVKRYIIHYQAVEGGIRILRVLHGSREQKKI